MSAPAVPRPAAHRALTDSGEEISPCKVNRIVRRFAKALVRSRLTFYEFLDNKANQRWVRGDPVLVRTIRYCDDPTGEKAARNVDRERGW
jgi:hypothetical protein